MKWSTLLFIFLLCATSARAQVHVGQNHQALNCFQYSSGLQSDYLCINQGLSSGWFNLQGDASMYTGPLCSDNNNSKCGFISVNDLTFGTTSLPLSPTPPLLNQCLVETAAGIAGVTCPGQSPILASTINTAIYTANRGCFNDGVNDDGPCVRSAIAAAAALNGHVVLSPLLYYINSGVTVRGTKCGLTFPTSNLSIEAYGATIQAGPTWTTGGALICMLPNTSAQFNGAFEDATAAPGYSIASGANVIGGTSLTLTTAGQTSNFAVGDMVFLKNLTGSGNRTLYVGINFVKALPGSGVITLSIPLSRDFTTNPGGQAVIADVQALATTDLTFRGGELLIPNHIMYAILMGQTNRSTIKDVAIVSQASTTPNDLISGIDLINATVDNVNIYTVCQSAFDMSSRGMSNVNVINSSVTETGPCSGTSLATLFSAGEAVNNITFDNLRVNDGTGYGYAAFGAGAINSKLINSTIVSNGNPSQALFSTLGAIDSHIENNHIERDDGTHVDVFLDGTDDILKGNTIKSQNTSTGSALEIGSAGALVSGNYISTSPATFEGVVIDQVPATFTENTVTSPTTAPRCITIGNPGSPQSAIALIVGNVLQTCTTPVFDATGGNVPNREIIANQGVADSLTNVFAASAEMTVGNPTGGTQGVGTVNATGYYLNGVAVPAINSGLLSWDGSLGILTNAAVKPAIAGCTGHFTKLACTATLTGACTTPPTINVGDVTTPATGTAVTPTTTVATLATASETLAFTSGDTIALEQTAIPGTCTVPLYSCSATWSCP